MNIANRISRHKGIIANGHTVILGWTGKTIFLLGEFAQMLQEGPKKVRRPIPARPIPAAVLHRPPPPTSDCPAAVRGCVEAAK